MSALTLIVIAKAPVPGRVKTRLTPPCSPEQAAGLAHAALHDTLQAVAATPAAARRLVLDGDLSGLSAEGFDVRPQRPGGLDDRLEGAFADLPGPALLVGMDTPQITPELLGSAARVLDDDAIDAVLGAADDGGWWCIGFRRPVAGAFAGVPMSVTSTCAEQRRRLAELGLRVGELPVLRDVDTISDARAVARHAPHTRFARAVGALA
jgi:rSAM/selenodomain-associated transferase 1